MPTETRSSRTVTDWFTNLPWQLTLIFVIAQNLIWWSYPLHYGRITGGTFQGSQLLLLAYTITISATSFLMFQANFKSLWAHVPILVSLLLAFSGIIRGNIEILVMLLMFSGFWLAVEMRWLKLQNVWGLIIYAILSTFPVSSAIFFFQNQYLSPTFLLNLLPLLACQTFFTVPIFETESRRRNVTALISGVLLILVTLWLRRSLIGVCAIGVIAVTYLFMNNFPALKQKYVPTAYMLFELVCYLLLVFA
ncbi:hypothetical protein ACRYI5_00390 [Furfurilactobacillus sp. WILCCON 0119]